MGANRQTLSAKGIEIAARRHGGNREPVRKLTNRNLSLLFDELKYLAPTLLG
jgi:hypothetical protein